MMGRTWFDNEQLDENERDLITKTIEEKWHYSFIFSHTCPYTWQPFDLFLSGLDQSTVDNTMEYWLDDIAKTANYDTWCFGHFHADRQQGEKGLMLYHIVITLDEAYERKI
jgi:3-oxoacid CoA-transferase subunit A